VPDPADPADQACAYSFPFNSSLHYRTILYFLFPLTPDPNISYYIYQPILVGIRILFS
jgi:hypothetical protein